MTRRCFVISPIGMEGTEVREHADDVYDFIIKPAMQECEIEVFRSDHLKEPGRISEQMFARILGDDLCVAVLTGNNPNCYYELAIAQAAGRPVIILQMKGELLPFDVQDLRCVYYDFKPRAIRDRTYVDEVVAHVQSLEASGWHVEPLVGSPGGSEPQSELEYVAELGDFGGTKAWMDLLRETSARFDIMGISLGSWRHSRGFAKVITERVAAGCRVRILLMHPDNPLLPLLINDSVDPAMGVDQVRQQVTWMYDFFARLAEDGKVEVRQMHTGCPHFQITLSDHRAVVIPYTYTDRVVASPLLHSSPDHPLYATLDREFTGMWAANA